MDVRLVPVVVVREVSLKSIVLKFTLFLFISILILPGAFAQQSIGEVLEKYNSGSVPYISVEELRMHQLEGDVVILDAREKEEYEVSHIKNATFVGFDEFDISKLDKFGKDGRIVVYCSVGVRSEKIGDRLQKAGYKNILNLYGGIFAWKDTGYEVIDSEGKKTERVHVYSKQWAKWVNNAVKVY